MGASGRVAKLRDVFDTPGGFIRNQARAPITPTNPLSNSGGGVTSDAAAHSLSPSFVCLPPGPREYNTTMYTGVWIGVGIAAFIFLSGVHPLNHYDRQSKFNLSLTTIDHTADIHERLS